MRKIGYLLIVMGIILFGFLAYSFIMQGRQTISPIPDDKGVKVIFISPTR